ncbi:hypothetical protein D3C87_1448610 [compost metagenome]
MAWVPVGRRSVAMTTPVPTAPASTGKQPASCVADTSSAATVMAVRATRAGVVFWVIAVVTLVMRSLAGYGMMRK